MFLPTDLRNWTLFLPWILFYHSHIHAQLNYILYTGDQYIYDELNIKQAASCRNVHMPDVQRNLGTKIPTPFNINMNPTAMYARVKHSD